MELMVAYSGETAWQKRCLPRMANGGALLQRTRSLQTAMGALMPG